MNLAAVRGALADAVATAQSDLAAAAKRLDGQVTRRKLKVPTPPWNHNNKCYALLQFLNI